MDDNLLEEYRLYLEDRELARQLFEYCHNAQRKILKRNEFEKKKKELEEARKNKGQSQPKVGLPLAVTATCQCRDRDDRQRVPQQARKSGRRYQERTAEDHPLLAL